MYQTYTSDSLRYLLESVTKAIGGRMPKYSYAELIGLIPDKEEKEPEQTAEEIINKFMADLGGK